LKGEHHFGDLGVEGRIMGHEEISYENVDWKHLAHDKE
jgi:hypothetical protein